MYIRYVNYTNDSNINWMTCSLDKKTFRQQPISVQPIALVPAEALQRPDQWYQVTEVV